MRPEGAFTLATAPALTLSRARGSVCQSDAQLKNFCHGKRGFSPLSSSCLPSSLPSFLQHLLLAVEFMTLLEMFFLLLLPRYLWALNASRGHGYLVLRLAGPQRRH